MASTYKTPGVYIEEISTLPASIAQVETAIPAFIGYTQRARKNGKPLANVPTKIDSLLEFEEYFGFGPGNLAVDVTLNSDNSVDSVSFTSSFCLYDSMRMFFSNGGGECYIVAVATYETADVSTDDAVYTSLSAGLNTLRKEDEPTLILFPDAVQLMENKSKLGTLQRDALKQCNDLQDRFCIMDLLDGDNDLDQDDSDGDNPAEAFRNSVGSQYLKYGASYYPNLRTTLSFDFSYENLNSIVKNGASISLGALSADSTYVDHMDKVVADSDTFDTLVDSPKDDPNWGGLLAFSEIEGGDVYSAFGFISDKYPTNSAAKNQVYARLEYIWFMVNSFMDLTMTDDTDEIDDGPGVSLYDLNTLHGERIAAGAGTNYSTIERVVRSLMAYNEGFSKDGGTTKEPHAIAGLTAGADTTIGAVTFETSAVTADSDIYGDGVANTYKAAAEASFSALYEMYETMVSVFEDFAGVVSSRKENLDTLLQDSNPIYSDIVSAVRKEGIVLPPSGAVAGIYAATDNERGVWVAPANRSLNSVVGPKINITSKEQEGLNVDATAGKSINAIRSFTGRGTLIWGARTLAGNSNEWRYVPVRRLFNMVEESVKKATEFVVFEPNDKNTWVRTKAMIENFLNGIWKAGGLAGAKAEHAYIVKVGLGETMTAQDILEGRMIIEIHMAAVRPAEFIVLRFMHKLQES